jgi:dTDP-4-dehydrorhamnose reductase
LRILITGSKGQLGSDCVKVLSQIHEIMAVDLDEMDITDTSAVKKGVTGFTPDILVNCAAYTKVDACETEKELAWKVNAEGPENLAAAAAGINAKFVHISTDYVFDGKKSPPEPYAEDDITSPLSYYGRTKLQGELAIRQTTDDHIIIRTAWVYGINGHNFLKTMLKLALKDPQNITLHQKDTVHGMNLPVFFLER